MFVVFAILMVLIAIKLHFKSDQWIFMLLGLCFWFFLTGCAPSGGGSSSGGGTTSKSLFSQWIQVADNQKIIDLSLGSQIGTSFVENYPTTVCSSDTTMVGDEASGTMTITNGRSSTSTPNSACASVNGTYTYSKTDTALTICVSVSDCAVFE